jgi:hypothetical protein
MAAVAAVCDIWEMGLWNRDYMTGRPYETAKMRDRRLERELDGWLENRRAKRKQELHATRPKMEFRGYGSTSTSPATSAVEKSVGYPLWFRLTVIVLVGLIAFEVIVFAVRP